MIRPIPCCVVSALTPFNFPIRVGRKSLTAKILKPYHTSRGGKKLVDFCAHIDSDSTNLAAAITKIRRNRHEHFQSY